MAKSREIRKAEKLLIKVNELKTKYSEMSDEELRLQTVIFKERIVDGATNEDLVVDAFAVAREATFRVLNKMLYDVQILGGLVLNMGSVAEMRTGEGKTLTSIPPVYLNALFGKGVIVSSVNEYLIDRDAEETGMVYNYLGLSIGVNKRDMDANAKKHAYSLDVTYIIHSELGFDYLRDNMVAHINQKTQRGFGFCLIDEVDSILIDEAKTPLIITGGESENSSLYLRVDQFASILNTDHFDIDLESNAISLKPEGIEKAQKFFQINNLYNVANSDLVHRIQNALRARHVMRKDVEYIVREDKIELVDTFTGRIMEGRSYSDGLHQAIQAKEKVEIEPETKTMATITYQNLFRMFTKLSGMTGTAKTEEQEFIDIYNMRVNVIPTNKPIIRKDELDSVYLSSKFKYEAIVEEIRKFHKKGQPILVGTSQVYQSEKISKMLKKVKVSHKILNAKQDEKEADIISSAGKMKSVTIATNMAGRGTDIQITDDVRKIGGLYVIGTDRAESRRIDNQLRGRSGRQGDPGISKFFLSLDDQLIKRFSARDRLKKTFSKFENKPIENKMMTKALTRAQKKIESFNFDSRKNVLQYDDVIRQQRDVMYAQRDLFISDKPILGVIHRMMHKISKEIVLFDSFVKNTGELDVAKLSASLNVVWFAFVDYKLDPGKLSKLYQEEVSELLAMELINNYDNFIRKNTLEVLQEDTNNYEKDVLLKTFDANWQVHIDKMDKLRTNSSMASYAQKNPFQEFTQKGYDLFNETIKNISHNAIKVIMQDRFKTPADNIRIQKELEKKSATVKTPSISKNKTPNIENIDTKQIKK